MGIGGIVCAAVSILELPACPWMVFSQHVLFELWLIACPLRDDASQAGGDASGSLYLSSLASKVGFACWLHCNLHSGTVWRWGKIQLYFTGQKHLQSYCISKIILYQMTSSCKFYFWRWEATLVRKTWGGGAFYVCAWEFPVLSEAQTSSGHNSSSSKALRHMDWQARGHCTPVTFSGVTCQ